MANKYKCMNKYTSLQSVLYILNNSIILFNQEQRVFLSQGKVFFCHFQKHRYTTTNICVCLPCFQIKPRPRWWTLKISRFHAGFTSNADPHFTTSRMMKTDRAHGDLSMPWGFDTHFFITHL